VRLEILWQEIILVRLIRLIIFVFSDIGLNTANACTRNRFLALIVLADKHAREHILSILWIPPVMVRTVMDYTLLKGVRLNTQFFIATCRTNPVVRFLKSEREL
jgi:hypothetical protein